LAQALLSAGLKEGLRAEHASRIVPLPFDPRRDPLTGLVNGGPIQAYSSALANEVQTLIERGLFPIVLGGDCSILLGPMLALRRRGPHGLFFLDGHSDFYQPNAEPSGEVASMELALMSGRGPRQLADIEGLAPLVRDRDIVAFGFRDEAQVMRDGGQDIRDTSIWTYGLEQIRSRGVKATAMEAVARLGSGEVQGFWIHLDADVLNDEDMPAVDYRQPGGLRFDELSEILQVLLATGRAVGLTVTIFNPTKDPEGAIALRFSESIIRGLSRP
jgi:arginase